jgi:hypothetical protein
MAEGFIRSPDAVLDPRAYQDAFPHWTAAWLGVAPTRRVAAKEEAVAMRMVLNAGKLRCG